MKLISPGDLLRSILVAIRVPKTGLTTVRT